MTTAKTPPPEKILITGGSGLIGSYILAHHRFGAAWQVLSPSHTQLDIADVNSVRLFFKAHHPSIVINFAAHRNANTAELQRDDISQSAWQVNVVGTQNIATVCKEFQAYLIHISTDFVFAGQKKRPGPYDEAEIPEINEQNLSWYGITKREAELKVKQTLDQAAIIRINNVTKPGNVSQLDYIGKIVWLYEHDQLYPLFKDQLITLTSVPVIMDIIDQLIETKKAGVFHAATIDLCTPYELATYTIDQMYHRREVVKSTSIKTFLKHNPRRYPQFGGLKTELTQKTLGLRFGSWREIVDRFSATRAALKKPQS